MSDLGEIVRRLDALEAVENIKKLKARYFRFVDEKKHDELAALFTPDAELVTDGITWKSPQEFAYTIRDLKKVNGEWLIASVLLTRFRMDPLENWTPAA